MGQVTTRTYDASSSGNNTLVTVGVAQYLILKKIKLTVESDIVGAVKILMGSTEVGKVRNPIVGGNHILVSNGEEGERFPLDDDLIVNLPDTTAVTVTASYVLKD